MATQMTGKAGRVEPINRLIETGLRDALELFDSDPAKTRILLQRVIGLMPEPTRETEGSDLGSGRASYALAPWQAFKVQSFIDANLCDQIPIDALASIARLSKSYFFRAFRGTFAGRIRQRRNCATGPSRSPRSRSLADSPIKRISRAFSHSTPASHQMPGAVATRETQLQRCQLKIRLTSRLSEHRHSAIGHDIWLEQVPGHPPQLQPGALPEKVERDYCALEFPKLQHLGRC